MLHGWGAWPPGLLLSQTASAVFAVPQWRFSGSGERISGAAVDRLGPDEGHEKQSEPIDCPWHTLLGDSGPGRQSRASGHASWGLQTWSSVGVLFWCYRASTVPWCIHTSRDGQSSAGAMDARRRCSSTVLSLRSSQFGAGQVGRWCSVGAHSSILLPRAMFLNTNNYYPGW
jgi:hypothetical protein